MFGENNFFSYDGNRNRSDTIIQYWAKDKAIPWEKLNFSFRLEFHEIRLNWNNFLTLAMIYLWNITLTN